MGRKSKLQPCVPPDSPTPPGGESMADPFNPARLRLSQDFSGAVPVQKLLTTVPVRRPDRQTFFRVHPAETHRLATVVIQSKEDNETYLVDRELWSQLT